MADSLKDVIEKLKQQKQEKAAPAPTPAFNPNQVGRPRNVQGQQQQQMQVPKQQPQPQPQYTQEYEDDLESEEELTEEEPAKEGTDEEQVAMEIELLHNEGRFRVELLHQLQEVNKNLSVIAQSLSQLSGGN